MKGMKFARRALVVALLAVSLFAITGCKEATDSVSAKERMEMFRDDVNAQKFGNLTTHLHSGASKAPNAAFWETYFSGVTDFSFTMIGNNATSAGSAGVFTFTLAEDDKDVYKIKDITKNGSSILTGY